MYEAPITELMTHDHGADETRPAKAAARALTAPIDSPAPWLANASTIALHLLPQPAVTLATIAARDAETPTWSALAIGIGGTDDSEFARKLERATRLSGELGNRMGPFVETDAPDAPDVLLRKVCNDADASMCAYLSARRGLGLHGFARVRVRVPVAPPELLLVIQADAPDPVWAADQTHCDALAHFAEAVAIGYAVRFVAPIRNQETLLYKLSETQRKIVPLLVEEKSEREIAGVLRRSRHTIHEHVKAIYQSWGVHSRHQARELWLGRRPRR